MINDFSALFILICGRIEDYIKKKIVKLSRCNTNLMLHEAVAVAKISTLYETLYITYVLHRRKFK